MLRRMMMAGGGGGPEPVTYATLNPLDKAATVALSGGNLMATGAGTANANGIVRSDLPLVGKRYFEAVFTNAVGSGATFAAGVATSAHALTASLGYANPDAWAFWGPQVGPRHNGLTATSSTSGAGTVIGFAVDQAGGKIWMRKDGIWLQGDPSIGTSPLWSNLSGSLYAAACPWANGAVVTMRFNPESFRDAAPAGYFPITAA